MRAPARYVVLMQFALAILAVIAVEDLLAIREGRREIVTGRPLLPWVPTLLGVATLVGLNAGLLPYGRHTAATVAGAAPGVALVATVTLLVILAARRVRWALPVLVVVTAADLALYGIRFIYQEPARSIPRLLVAVQPAPSRPEDSYAAAPEVGNYVKNILVMRGYRLTTGYVGFFPAVLHPIGGELSLLLSGTRWTFTREGFRRPALGGVERARLIDDRGQQVIGRCSSRPTGRATSRRPCAPAGRRSSPSPSASTTGWTATAGGRPIEIVRVEYDFLGCRVDPGVEQVELRFAPRSFRNGMIVSAIGAALLAGVLLVWRP